MKKIILLALLIVSFSCKNNEEQTIKEQPVVEVKKPNIFIIELDMKYANSESIRLYANDLFINNNRTMSISLTEKIDQSEDLKKVVLDFPENIRPDFEVGLALGSEVENTIEIARIKISYGDVEFDIAPNALKDYFTFSKYIEYDAETGKLLTKKIDGKLYPIMYMKGTTVRMLSN